MFPWDLDRSYSVPSSSLITKKGNKHAVHDFIKWRLLLRLATDEINHNLHPLAHTRRFPRYMHFRFLGPSKI